MAYARVELNCDKCGDKFTWSKFYHKSKEALAAEEWAINGGITTCPKCLKESQDEKKIKIVCEWLNESNDKLINLEGTIKQIEWAESIRLNAVICLMNIIENSRINSNATKNDDKYLSAKKKLIDFFNSEPSASYWIENRNEYIDEISSLRQLKNYLSK